MHEPEPADPLPTRRRLPSPAHLHTQGCGSRGNRERPGNHTGHTYTRARGQRTFERQPVEVADVAVVGGRPAVGPGTHVTSDSARAGYRDQARDEEAVTPPAVHRRWQADDRRAHALLGEREHAVLGVDPWITGPPVLLGELPSKAGHDQSEGRSCPDKRLVQALWAGSAPNAASGGRRRPITRYAAEP